MYMSKEDFIKKGYIMLDKYYMEKEGLQTEATVRMSDLLENLEKLDNSKFDFTISLLMEISNASNANELLNLFENEIENSFE